MMPKPFSLGLALALGLLGGLSTGCEVSTCKGASCFDDDGDDGSLFDGDDGEDGGDGDGSSDGDAGQDGDAGEDGSDGADGDDGPGLASVEAFCEEQLRVGAAWESALSACCTPRPDDQADFLLRVLLYPPNPIATCVNARQSAINGGNVTFRGARAQACADAFNAAYEAPPDGCPAEGFDLRAIEGRIGKGAPSLKQIPACRETFVGSLTQGQPCTDQFECAGELRCLPMSGSANDVTRACLEPVPNAGICFSASDCDDGLVCLGLTGAGDDGVCRPANALSSFNAECGRSSQCEDGLLCEEEACTSAAGGEALCTE